MARDERTMTAKFNFNDKRTWYTAINKKGAERIERNLPKEQKKIAAEVCKRFGIKV